MNILIDHGGAKNIGDNLMLSNVLNYILDNTMYKITLLKADIPLFVKIDKKEINAGGNISELLTMPHWRILDYRTQKGILRHICGLIFWIILIYRALTIVVGTILLQKFKLQLPFCKVKKYWVEILANMDAYWVVGGGNINDIWMVSVAFWKMIFAFIFRLQHKKVIFSGQGIGPINKLTSKLIVWFGIKQMSLLSLREKKSKILLEKLGVNLDRTCIVGDDALTFFNDVDVGKSSLQCKYITMNIRISHYSLNDECLIDKYCLLIQKLLEEYKDFKFIFVPIALNKGDSDIEAAEKIMNNIVGYEDRLSIFKDTESLFSLKTVLKNASFALGVSYHFCLFSLSLGVSTVGLYANDYYAQKLHGLMEMFERKSAVLDLRTQSESVLIKCIKESFEKFEQDVNLEVKNCMAIKWKDFMKRAVNTINESTS